MSFSTVTSEALQLKLLQLLPIQQGFGTDLSASDTIIPIIDLTEAAEGSGVPEYLQRALAHGSNTEIDESSAGTTVIANVSGFYQLQGTIAFKSDSGGARKMEIQISDGSTSKTLDGLSLPATNDINSVTSYNLLFFVETGGSASLVLPAGISFLGSIRQVATSDGTLVHPVWFYPSIAITY